MEEESGGALAPLGAARILCRSGRCDEAATAVAEAVATDPTFGHAYSALGVCLDGAGRTEEADQAYARALILRRGLRFAVDDPYQRIQIAKLYDVPGRHHMLYDWFEEPFNRVNPSDPAFDIERIDWLEATGRHDEIQAVFAEVLAADPTLDVVARIERYHRDHSDAEQGAEIADYAAGVRSRLDRSVTRDSYGRTQAVLEARGIRLVVVQYPTRPLAPLVELREWNDDVVFVDNEAIFLEALTREPYDALFWDACFGSFGHTTERGSRLLAGNVADAILAMGE